MSIVGRHGLRSRLAANRIKRPTTTLGQPDYILVGLLAVLLIFGLAMLSSASSVESFRRFGDTYYLVWRHITHGVVPGLFFCALLSHMSYRRLERWSLHFFIIALILLVAVFIPGLGVRLGGAQSWVGIAGISFQPTEPVKLLLILALAGWFGQRGRSMTSDFWNGMVPFTILLGIICLPIIAQPDIGTLVVVVGIALVMYFTAGAAWRHLVALLVVGGGTFAFLIAHAAYRLARFMTFLHPELDPQGVGYHINQAFLAIGSGGWWGYGFGLSRQKFAYLPEVMGDSIFAVMAEELGFFFAVGLIILFLAITYRGWRLAERIDDPYGRFILVGVMSWFIIQAFANIGAMVGLLPLTGIPLPLISYGGSAIASCLAAIGIVINISRSKT